MQGKSITIYALIDPRDGGIRYVGQATDPVARLSAHLCGRDSDPGAQRTAWLRDVVAAGLVPRLRILARVSAAHADDAEQRHYLRCLIAGCALVNDHIPGLGCSLEHLVRDYPRKRAARQWLPPGCQGRKLDVLEILAAGGYPGAQEALAAIAGSPSCCTGSWAATCTRLSPAEQRRRERVHQALVGRIACAIERFCERHDEVDDAMIGRALHDVRQNLWPR